MTDPEPSKRVQNAQVAITGPRFERKRRRKFENGQVVEYYEDVPVVETSATVTKTPAPTELYKEWKFDADISLGRVFPSLKGTRFDAFTLTDTVMIWLAKDATETRKAGLWFETNVQFQGMLSPAADILRDIFKQEKPGIHMLAHLGVQQGWGDGLLVDGFTFKGSIEGINVGFGDFLMFRNAGIMLTIASDKLNRTETVWSFCGALHLNIPNSTVPLVMQYSLTPTAESLDIAMTFGTGEKWSSVFGVSGLDLDQVRFETSVPKSDVRKSLGFGIAAKWSIGDVAIELTGRFDKTEAFLTAYIETLTLNDLRKLFATLTGGGDLDPVQQDIRFARLTIEISKGRLLFSGEVWVDSYQVAAAEVLLSVDGIRISGVVDDLHIGEDVFIQNASLELVIGRAVSKTDASTKSKGLSTTKLKPLDKHPDEAVLKPSAPNTPPTPGKKSGVAVAAVIRGKVQMKVGRGEIDFDVVAAISKSPQGSLTYFVYGELTGDTLCIGKLLPSGTMKDDDPLNLYLNKVAVIACSGDGVDECGLNSARYPTRKGISVCAQLSKLPYVDKFSKDAKDDDCYILQAGYSTEQGLSVRVNLPENIRIEFSPEFVSGPLYLAIETKDGLMIQFGAVLWYKPFGQDEPLEFRLALNADVTQATAFAQMKGWWLDPLGLSPRLKIGPMLALEVSIVYEQFLATGMPSGLGLVGGFVVDNIDEYQLALSLGTNPKEMLVHIKATKFDSKQVINLINAAADLEIEHSEQEIIRFEDVNVYASPLGCLIGTQVYPAGFAVKGKAFIFGKKVEVDCELGKDGLKLKGEIENFSLGPLSVRGGKRSDGSRTMSPVVDIEIKSQRQHFEISGSISLWDLEASIFVLAELYPETQLEFNFELGWSDLLKFQVNGKLVNSGTEKSAVVSLHNLEGADFELHAVMEQKILSSVAESMQKWFNSASQSVHEGIDEAKRKLDEAQQQFVEACERAEKEVADARAAFDRKMEAAQSDLRRQQQEIEVKKAEEERKVIAEENRAQEQIDAAQDALNTKQKAFEDDMEAKKRELATTKREAEESVDSKIKDLQSKRVSLQESFGNAIEAIQNAVERVQSQQYWVDEAQESLDAARREYDDCAWYEAPFMLFKIGALEVERFAKQCALDAAVLILRIARAVVEGPAYQIASGAIGIAEGVLAGARDVLSGIISGMQAALDGVIAVHAAVIDVAKAAVTAALGLASEIKKAAYKVRQLALEVYQGILRAAEAVVEAVAKGVDFLAFQTALAALEFVKNDRTLINIAKAGLDAAEAVAQAALKAAAWLADKLCSTLDIQLIELTASLGAVCGRKGAFTIRVKGIVFGQAFDLTASWSPKDTLTFIIDMCKTLWDMFMKDIGKLFIEG